MIDDFIKYLCPQGRHDDKNSLNDYREWKIDVGELKRQMFHHNQVPLEVQKRVSDEEFENWLISLGWRRVICTNYRR